MLYYRYIFISKRFILFLLFNIIITNGLFCQQNDEILNLDSLDKVHGLDPFLYNGIIYKSFYPSNVLGDQYLSSKNYKQGDATIRGVNYKNLELNFDVYKQEVLLKYLNSNNVYNIIMLSKTWLENFTIGDNQFILFSTPEESKRIYQVLGKDSLRLLYYYKKDLKLESVSGSKNYVFIPRKEQYVLINQSLNKYYRNKSFIRIFKKEKQIIIKKYLRRNKIKVNNASSQIMEDLINYCSKLSVM
ncbi:MAG: hypothetical protein EHM93_07615 [Bacteroidales bacterium]|nr:MAG: hypothetical protein EHM93_07615 [Bacteroidales bacterium]